MGDKVLNPLWGGLLDLDDNSILLKWANEMLEVVFSYVNHGDTEYGMPVTILKLRWVG